MQFNNLKFAYAASATAGIMYIVCAAFTALWHDTAVRLAGYIMHVIDIQQLSGDVVVTWGGAIIGLIEIVIYVFVFAWIFAWLYNRFVK